MVAFSLRESHSKLKPNGRSHRIPLAANATTKVLQPQVHHLVELGADPHQNVTAIRNPGFTAIIFWTSNQQTQDVSRLLSPCCNKVPRSSCTTKTGNDPAGGLRWIPRVLISYKPVQASGYWLNHHPILILPPIHRHSTCSENAPPAHLMLDLSSPLS